jgi:hypothetical protein
MDSTVKLSVASLTVGIAFSWEMKFAGEISFANPSHQVIANCLKFALALGYRGSDDTGMPSTTVT